MVVFAALNEFLCVHAAKRLVTSGSENSDTLPQLSQMAKAMKPES